MTFNNNDQFIRESIVALCACFVCILICIASMMGFMYAILIFNVVFFICLALCVSYCLYCKHVKSLEKEDKQYGNIEITEENKPYNPSQRTKRFLTQSEREFKEILQKHLPPHIEIYCNVHLRDILEKKVADGLNMRNWDDRTIAMMHVDYALIDKYSENIILAIELDGKSHDNTKAARNDRLKNGVLKKSDIPFKRVLDTNKDSPELIEKIVNFCKKATI